jgi:hypothetical protein
MWKSTKKSKLLLFFVGIFVGFIITLMFGWLMSYIDPSFLELTSSPRSFGSINISVVSDEPDSIKMLLMTKDDIPFFAIDADKSGEIKGLSLIKDGKGALSFTLRPSDVPGKWERAIYANENKNGKFNGEMYVDINFDGQFDVKHVFDDNGQKVSCHIYTQGIWTQVDSGDLSNALSGQTEYHFDPNLGWQEN